MWSQKYSEFWLKWLEKYKSLPCLWDTKSKDYTNKAKRNDAYVELVIMAQQLNENADEAYVRRRINCFRSSFRRQMKKAMQAKKNRLEYTSSTYYFDLLKSFLRPFDTDDEDNLSADDEVTNDCNELPDDNNCHKSLSNLMTYKLNGCDKKRNTQETPVSPQRKGCRSMNSRNIKITYKQNLEDEDKTDDEHSLFGKQLATHFRSMKPEQRLFAEKLVSDVCVYARLGKLTMESDLIIES